MKNLFRKSLMGKKAIVSMFAVVAVLALSLATMTSCEKTEQTMVYCVEIVDFNDNTDILRSSIDKGFEEAGFKSSLNHIWQTFGTESSCNQKATTAFQKRVKEIDKDRTQLKDPFTGLSLPLAIKGVTVKLINLGSGNKEIEIDSYTFVEEDL